MTDGGLGELGFQLRRVADDLEQSSDRLRQSVAAVQSRTFRAASPDGHVEIVVDGRYRVSSITLSTRGSDRDAATLGRQLTSTLNDALGRARKDTNQAVLDALPDRVRQSVEQVVEDSRLDTGR